MKEIYIPVCVIIDDDGSPLSGYVDYEGAPWMYCGTQEAVYDDDTDEWESSAFDGPNAEVVDAAERWLHDRMSLAVKKP